MRGAARLSCVTGNTGGSQAHHTRRVQAGGNERVSSGSSVTELVSVLSKGQHDPGRDGEWKVRPNKHMKPMSRNMCAVRAVTDEVNDLHHAA